MIRSYKNKDAEAVFNRTNVKSIGPELSRTAHKKLILIDAASSIEDLRVPPGNRLEQLFGDRKGQHSIRINQQYRICFTWNDGAAEDVEITDYH